MKIYSCILKRKLVILTIITVMCTGFAQAASDHAVIFAQNIDIEEKRLSGQHIRISSPTNGSVRGIAAIGMNITYDSSKIILTNASSGDYNSFFGFYNPGNGYAMINVFIIGTEYSGNTTVATVAFRAIGNAGESTSIQIDPIVVANKYGVDAQIRPYALNVSIISETIPEDVNKDGLVDISDLVIIGQHFGQNPGLLYPRYDIDQDMFTNINDIIPISNIIRLK